MVVERDKPGGICLNVGCIPSKALINAAKYYDKLRHGADIGILADNLRVDMGKMQSWKGEVVGKLTGGVRTLLKANGCDYRTGTPKLTSRNTVEVTDKEGQVTTVQADNIIIATGSRTIEIPGFNFDGKRIVDSTGALDFTTVPERFVVDWRRLHRPRDRDPLREAGGASHGGGSVAGLLPGIDPGWSSCRRASSRSWASRSSRAPRPSRGPRRAGAPSSRWMWVAKKRRSTPTRCWCRWAFGRTSRGWAWRRSASRSSVGSSPSTSACAPTCPASTPSVTWPGNRCWRTRLRARRRSRPRSSPGTSRSTTSAASRP